MRGLTLPVAGMEDLTPREARRLDLNSEDLGVPVSHLMGNAGKALAKAVLRHARKGSDVLILCGKGNNGGDGFAAALHLRSQGVQAWVVLAEKSSAIATAASRGHFGHLDSSWIALWRGRPEPAWGKVPILVDCLLGSGLVGTPREPYASIIKWVNGRRSHARVISCDIPSGLGTSVAIRPHATVTFHARKQGMTAANSGRIEVASIGIPPSAHDIGLGDFDLAYRRPAHDSHKGDNGIILVVGGSVPLLGAPVYVALGALRTGADLVHLAVPAAGADVMRGLAMEPIVHAVGHTGHLGPDALPTIDALLDRVSAVVVGPGLGRHKATLAATRSVLQSCVERDLPTVVDADGLDALEEDLLRRHGSRMALTPHAREFQDLTGKTATRANVQAYARKHSVTVLRKSSVDVVSNGGQTRECHRGHPTLTVGGTGDVLAGITAALLAKGAAPFESACAASYLLKSAGEVAASMRSYGASAVDVAEAIPSILLRLP